MKTKSGVVVHCIIDTIVYNHARYLNLYRYPHFTYTKHCDFQTTIISTLVYNFSLYYSNYLTYQTKWKSAVFLQAFIAILKISCGRHNWFRLCICVVLVGERSIWPAADFRAQNLFVRKNVEKQISNVRFCLQRDGCVVDIPGVRWYGTKFGCPGEFWMFCCVRATLLETSRCHAPTVCLVSDKSQAAAIKPDPWHYGKKQVVPQIPW